MKHRAFMPSAVAVALTVFVAGCAQGDEPAPQPEQTATAQLEDAPPAPPATPENSPTAPRGGPGLPVEAAQQALQTAAQAVPNGRPFDLEVETRNGERVFDVEVASDGNEFELVIDATGTQVISQSQESTPDDDVWKVESARIDVAQALQTAADREPGAAMDELEIDTEDGVLVWEIELVRPDGTEIEIEVDARDGTIR